MKVLLINGSPRQHGNTNRALEEVAKQLQSQGIDSEIEWIGTKPVRGCVACGKCKEQGLGRCVFDDDICNQVIAKMNEADGLVVGSPVYYGTPTGPILSLLHRMGYSSSAKMDGKPVAAVTVCRRGGATAAYQTLLMPFLMLNMPVVTSQYWNIAYGRSEGESGMDAEGMQTMRTLANNMAWMLKKIQTGDGNVPQREEWNPTNFIR